MSPQPEGRFRLPGLLAASRLYSATDADRQRNIVATNHAQKAAAR